MPGMALQGNKCVQCDGAGQVMVRGRCKRCPRLCNTCTSTARCSADGCADGASYRMRSGKCVPDVPAPAPGPEPETESSS